MTDHLAHALRIASTIACAVVVAAFAMWASDQGQASSDSQVARLAQENGPVGTAPAAQSVPEEKHDGVRGAVESASDALLSPFDHVAESGGPWPAHGIPVLLALLTYGLLARILIAYLPART